jgi:hypothetical protein
MFHFMPANRDIPFHFYDNFQAVTQAGIIQHDGPAFIAGQGFSEGSLPIGSKVSWRAYPEVVGCRIRSSRRKIPRMERVTKKVIHNSLNRSNRGQFSQGSIFKLCLSGQQPLTFSISNEVSMWGKFECIKTDSRLAHKVVSVDSGTFGHEFKHLTITGFDSVRMYDENAPGKPEGNKPIFIFLPVTVLSLDCNVSRFMMRSLCVEEAEHARCTSLRSPSSPGSITTRAFNLSTGISM